MLINDLPRYEILDESALAELERGWRRIVSDLGIEFLHDDALEYLRGAGQEIDGQLVKFDPDWILEQVEKAPAEFELQAEGNNFLGRCREFLPVRGMRWLWFAGQAFSRCRC